MTVKIVNNPGISQRKRIYKGFGFKGSICLHVSIIKKARSPLEGLKDVTGWIKLKDLSSSDLALTD